MMLKAVNNIIIMIQNKSSHSWHLFAKPSADVSWDLVSTLYASRSRYGFLSALIDRLPL